jgi:hypothetical protein
MPLSSFLILALIAAGLGLFLYLILHPLDLERIARLEGVPYDPRGLCCAGAVRPLWINYGRFSLLYPMAVELDESGLRISERTIRGALHAPLDWIKASISEPGKITGFKIITNRGKRLQFHPDAEEKLAARYLALVKSGRIAPSSDAAE